MTSEIGAVILLAGSNSPVSAASLIRRDRASIRRMSAVTTSPASSRTRSPGTSWAAGTTLVTPARMMRADGLVIRFSASIARSARYSWTNPMIPLSATMTRMIAVSLRSPMAAVIAAAPSRTRIIAFVNCSASRRQADLAACSSSSFGPCVARRRRASSGSRPRSASEPRAATTSERIDAPRVAVAIHRGDDLELDLRGLPSPGNMLMLLVRVRRTGRPVDCRSVRSQASTPRHARRQCRSDRSAASALPNRAVRPLADDAGPRSVRLGPASTAPADRSCNPAETMDGRDA